MPEEVVPGSEDGNKGGIDTSSPEFLAAVQSAAAGEVAGLKTNRDEVLAEKRELKTAHDALKGQLAELGDFDTIKSMVERFKTDDEARLIAEGKIDEVLNKRTDALRKDAESRIGAATARVGELEGQLESAQATIVGLQVDSSIDQAAAKLECAPTAIADIRRAAREVFSLNAESNTIEARTDGVVQMGPDGTSALTPASWLEQQKKASPHWWGPSAGGGAGGGVGVPGKDGNDIKNFEQMSGKKKLAALMGRGAVRR